MLGFGVTNGSETATLGSGTRSARSSFATNIDHGLTPDPSMVDIDIIPVPPMAEIRPNIVHAEVPTEMLVNVDTGSNRSSVASSYSGTQYIMVPNASDHNLELPTPMMVSPFTPTESFAFPQPPVRPTTAEGDASITEAAKVSSLWLTKPVTPPPVPSPAVLAGAPPPSPAHVPPRGSTANPFSDPIQNTESFISGEIAEPEIVWRRFAPTLGDELSVEPGDTVAIRKVFDDGWAYVEKGPEKGLVPLDCLRDAEQDLPAFLAARRVSSYGGHAM